MTCSEVERLLPELLDGAPGALLGGGDDSFQTAFDNHVKSCPVCSDLVGELKTIASEARELAENEEPSPRVWLQIAAQLRAEGLIREPDAVAARPIMVPASRGRWWSAWWLAPVAAALVAASSYIVNHKPTSQVAQQNAPANAVSATQDLVTTVAAPEKPAVTSASVHAPAQQPSHPTNVPATTVESAPSPEDQQFLSVVSTRAPSMRATYESQLQVVNVDIRETQAYVNRNPGDADARQHLMDAYQQKALLYQIALDRIQ
jgi:hypothetical protein